MVIKVFGGITVDCRKVKKIFRVVGIKGGGAYANFGTEVPKLAQQFLTRLDEVENHSGTEIALFEPKRDANHLLKWADDQGYKRDLESHIVETYHPMENGEEEVEIYLPIHI